MKNKLKIFNSMQNYASAKSCTLLVIINVTKIMSVFLVFSCCYKNIIRTVRFFFFRLITKYYLLTYFMTGHGFAVEGTRIGEDHIINICITVKFVLF